MLFEEKSKHRICSRCNRPMPKSTRGTICPSCKDYLLFKEVKAYLEENIATEIEVADHFNIPLQQVRYWIQDGRLVYREHRW